MGFDLAEFASVETGYTLDINYSETQLPIPSIQNVNTKEHLIQSIPTALRLFEELQNVKVISNLLSSLLAQKH